jgi:hypothetical protein
MPWGKGEGGVAFATCGIVAPLTVAFLPLAIYRVERLRNIRQVAFLKSLTFKGQKCVSGIFALVSGIFALIMDLTSHRKRHIMPLQGG